MAYLKTIKRRVCAVPECDATAEAELRSSGNEKLGEYCPIHALEALADRHNHEERFNLPPTA